MPRSKQPVKTPENQKQAKLKIAQDILSEMDIPIWMVYSDHGSDDAFEMLAGKTMPASILLLSPTDKRIIVNSLDADNLSEDNMAVYGTGGYKNHLISALKEMGFTNKLALNYSTSRDISTDRIGAGTRDWIDGIITKAFPGIAAGNDDIRDVVISAENVIYALYDRKTPDEVKKMRIAAGRADDILQKTFSNLKPGMTDWDAYHLVHRIMQEKPDYFSGKGVVSEDFAWKKDGCPIVLTGETFTKGGHAMPRGEIIKPGNTVYFDFGVRLTFSDGSSWCSDIQRMGYVLRKGEREASPEAAAVFNLLYNAVSRGIECMEPGMYGYEIDDKVRSIINHAGYDYGHGTGHPVGQKVHSPGTHICPLSGPQGKNKGLKIQPNGVYTIEPRIPIINGGSIEEMVLARQDRKNETLCKRQEKLYLIQSR